MSSKGSYIWDEWSDGDDELPRTTISVAKIEQDLQSYENDEIDTRTTISSIGLESFGGRNVTKTSRTMAPISSLSVRTTNSNLEEISDKVTKMKTENNQKLQDNKELQAELLRLQNAQERRRMKIEQQYGKQLTDIRQEHSGIIKPMEEFYARISNDTKKLQQQQQDLTQKFQHLSEDSKLLTENQLKDNERRLQKQKKQWESDEKLTIEKVLATRQETMKKHAADYFAPKLQDQVRRNQEKLLEKRQENEQTLEKLKIVLEAENQRKLLSYQQEIHDKLPQELGKVTKLHDKRLQQIQQSFQEEEHRTQTSYQRKREMIETNYHEKVNQELNSFQELSRKLQEKEQKTIEEMTHVQQQEMKEKMKQYAEEIQQWKQSQKEQIMKSRNILEKKEALNQQILYESIINQVQQQVMEQTQEIVRKLQSDHHENMRSIQEEYDTKMKDLRLQIDDQLSYVTNQEEKSIKRQSEIHKEINSLQYDIQTKQKKIPQLLYRLNSELKPQVISLRDVLHTLEEEYQQKVSQSNEEIQGKKMTCEDEIDGLQRIISELKKKHISQQDSLVKREQQVAQDQQAELERIQLKIQVVLRKKDQAIEALTEELHSLQQDHRSLQDRLEDVRNTKFG